MPVKIKAKVDVWHLRDNQPIKYYYFPCRSFTRWFKRFVGVILSGTGTKGFSKLRVKDIDGAERDVDGGCAVRDYNIVKNIAIGESNEDFEWNQHHLLGFKMWATGLTKSIDLSEQNETVRYELTGTFNITSAFTVWETGLFGEFRDTGAVLRTFLASRDRLHEGIPVVPDDIIIVRYRVVIG